MRVGAGRGVAFQGRERAWLGTGAMAEATCPGNERRPENRPPQNDLCADAPEALRRQPAFSARTVRPFSFTSAKPPTTGMISGAESALA